VNRSPVPGKESSHPAPLSDGQWADLARPLRRYAPPDSASTWDRDFRRHVGQVVALFQDSEAPAEEWVQRAMSFLAFATKTAGSGRRLEGIDAASMYRLLSARARSQPRRATALAAMRKVETQAARLGAALDAAIRDPWLSVAADSEVISAEFQKHLAERRLAAGLDGAPAEPARDHIFAETRDALLKGTADLARLRDAAQLGIHHLQGHQLRGRPAETAARMPAKFLCAVAKCYAPSPSHGQVQRWRGDLFEFVREVLSASRLPRVTPEFVDRVLR
jgi:hypothetical protein